MDPKAKGISTFNDIFFASLEPVRGKILFNFRIAPELHENILIGGNVGAIGIISCQLNYNFVYNVR